ncbi:MAG: hypothetical protein H0V37_07425 [Chloroflexia bacterium]|nr:hypothetical protein [Chloroflexia bacterium]
MTIITLATLALALVAGWGIGQLAGGGSGESDLAVRAIPTLEPVSSVAPDPTPTVVTTPAASPSSDGDSSSPAAAPATPAVQPPTSVPVGP